MSRHSVHPLKHAESLTTRMLGHCCETAASEGYDTTLMTFSKSEYYDVLLATLDIFFVFFARCPGGSVGSRHDPLWCET